MQKRREINPRPTSIHFAWNGTPRGRPLQVLTEDFRLAREVVPYEFNNDDFRLVRKSTLTLHSALLTLHCIRSAFCTLHYICSALCILNSALNKKLPDHSGNFLLFNGLITEECLKACLCVNSVHKVIGVVDIVTRIVTEINSLEHGFANA